MTKAWKQRKRQAFLEPKAHLPASSRDGSLNLHSSGESPWSLQGLEKEYDSSRPWIIYRAFLGHTLSMSSQVTLVVKNLPANARDVRDTGSILGSGRSPERGNDSPLQYFCLENRMDIGAWQATVHSVANSRTRLKRFSTHCLCQVPEMSKTHYTIA